MSAIQESSSDSDDDDNIRAFKEATDTQFLNDHMFHSEPTTENDRPNEIVELPKSLRRSNEIMDESNEFPVTQDFKNYVAKQLSKTLDSRIEIVFNEVVTNPVSKQPDSKLTRGIKLLNDSRTNLIEIDMQEDCFRHNKRSRQTIDMKVNNTEHIAKCKAVAVDPDWILSKSSTLAWTDRRKGTVFYYKKLENGILMEVE